MRSPAGAQEEFFDVWPFEPVAGTLVKTVHPARLMNQNIDVKFFIPAALSS